MNVYEQNRRWSDQFMPQVKQILGLYLIGEANEVEDGQHNTDLIVLSMAAVRIGCRMRRPGYTRYADEFTIRASLPTNGKTELAKIIEGWGDYFFYGHAGTDGRLSAWALCDFKPFRLWFNRYMYAHGGQHPGVLQRNSDRSSDFLAFRFAALPPEFIVARKPFQDGGST